MNLDGQFPGGDKYGPQRASQIMRWWTVDAGGVIDEDQKSECERS